MKFVALIPARAGSVRLPKKNTLPVGGIPMLVRAVHDAMGSEIFDEILVSTDDVDGMMECYNSGPALLRGKNQVVRFIERPPELATGDAGMWGVVAHTMTGREYDAVMLLQPSSPLRDACDIAVCAELLLGWDAVVSVTDIPPDDVFQTSDGTMKPTKGLVRPNGAIYALRAAVVAAGAGFYPQHTRAYWMAPDRSIDVDTIVDLERAEAYLKGRIHG